MRDQKKSELRAIPANAYALVNRKTGRFCRKSNRIDLIICSNRKEANLAKMDGERVAKIEIKEI